MEHEDALSGETKGVLSPVSDPVAAIIDERPLPFLLRRCVRWVPLEDEAGRKDGVLKFWKRAGLTGDAALTRRGQDVGFSDLEVS